MCIAPEVPEHSVVATGHHDPSLQPATLGDPSELALAEVRPLEQPRVLGFQPQESRRGRLLPHAVLERVGFLVLLVLQVSSY